MPSGHVGLARGMCGLVQPDPLRALPWRRGEGSTGEERRPKGRIFCAGWGDGGQTGVVGCFTVAFLCPQGGEWTLIFLSLP